jgi:hypothetical protein
MRLLPQRFWDWALDGQPHTIDISQWGFPNMPVLRTTLYQKAEVAGRNVKTHKVAPFVLAFVAWRGGKEDFPGLDPYEATTINELIDLPGYVPPPVLPPVAPPSRPKSLLDAPLAEVSLEEILPPCTCEVGSNLQPQGHPPDCRVWGVR